MEQGSVIVSSISTKGLIVGAVIEGAMVISTSDAPSAEIRRYVQALKRLLYGIRIDHN